MSLLANIRHAQMTTAEGLIEEDLIRMGLVDPPKLVGCQRRLGGFLKGLRKAQWKVSIEDMANRIGCSKSYLWDVENNHCMPSFELAARMAKHYKTTLTAMAKHLDYEVTN